MPNKTISLKMPSLPSIECKTQIELANRVSQLRQAGVEFDAKVAELERLFQTALNDLRGSYSETVDNINGRGEDEE